MCIFSEMNEFFILLFKNREGMIFALSCILEKRISLQSLNFSWAEEHSQMEHSLLLCTCTNWQNIFLRQLIDKILTENDRFLAYAEAWGYMFVAP